MRFTLLGLMALCASVAYAGTTQERADRPGLPTTIEAHRVAGGLPTSSRTLLGIVVGNDSLKDVRHRLGNSAIKKIDNEDGRPNIVCYRSSDASDDTMVVFEAGPLGGFQTTTAVTVGHASAFGSLADGCLATAKVTKATARAGHLGLGGAIQTAARALKAKPTVSSAGVTEIALEKIVNRWDKASGK